MSVGYTRPMLEALEDVHRTTALAAELGFDIETLAAVTIDDLRRSVEVSGYRDTASNAERNRAKAARRKARGK